MGESMSVGCTGGSVYRCTRGNCGADIGHPVNQDAHNHTTHLDREDREQRQDVDFANSLMLNGQTPDEGYAEEKADYDPGREDDE